MNTNKMMARREEKLRRMRARLCEHTHTKTHTVSIKADQRELNITLVVFSSFRSHLLPLRCGYCLCFVAVYDDDDDDDVRHTCEAW